MSVRTIITGALFAAAPLAAASSVTIQNNCAFNMYLWQIDSPESPSSPTATLAPKGQSGSSSVFPYTTNPDGGGVSFKMAPNNNENHAPEVVQQFEYTLSRDKIFYDISNINGNPLMDYGSSLFPTEVDTQNNCKSLACPAGETKCAAAYNKYNDDQATHSCFTSIPLTAYLCGNDTSSASSSAPAVSAPSSTNADPAPLAAPVAAPPVAKQQVNAAAVQAQSWSSSAAPSVTQAPAQPAPVVVQATTFATVTATAAPVAMEIGPDGAARVPNHKRHLHEHANAHHHNH